MKPDVVRLEFDLTGRVAEQFLRTSVDELRPVELHAIFLIRKALGLGPPCPPCSALSVAADALAAQEALSAEGTGEEADGGA
jgi:hypothetical protein